jgi:hypothetical protein
MKLHKLDLTLDDQGTLINVERVRDGQVIACGLYVSITEEQRRRAIRAFNLTEVRAINAAARMKRADEEDDDEETA